MSYYTKNDFVYKKLKDEIIEGKLRSGERIIISEVAKRYKVSSMPVREAIKRLQQEGFLEVIPHVGAKVASFDLEKFKELALIRIELESLATRLATPYIDHKKITKLEKIIKEMEQCVEENDNQRYAELNKQFHTIIYSSSPYSYLYDLIMSLWAKSEFSRTIFTRLSGRTKDSINEHKEWLKALKEKNEVKASKIARKHKEVAFKLLIDSFEKDKTTK